MGQEDQHSESSESSSVTSNDFAADRAALEQAAGDNTADIFRDEIKMDWRNKSVLIIEDENQMANLLASIFRQKGAKARIALDGESGLLSLAQENPDLLLVDLGLPGIDGFDVLRAARRRWNVPLVIVTAKSRHDLLAGGLEAGADDYIRKPFRQDELLARAWAVMRTGRGDATKELLATYDDGYLCVNTKARTITVGRELVNFSDPEFRLLAFLVSHRDKICTYQEILDSAQIVENQDAAEMVHVLVWQIRQKLEPNPRKPTYVISAHGFGYQFKPRGAVSPNN